jgi:hypothetical protein
MATQRHGSILVALALAAVSLSWAGPGNPTPVSKPVPLAVFGPKAPKAKPATAPAPAKASPGGNLQGTVAPAQPILGDAFIAQNLLRIYLNRPAAVSVFNSRGQQIFHMESQRALETVPLQGITTGFVYLTVRAGQVELTKKLVYTGK